MCCCVLLSPMLRSLVFLFPVCTLIGISLCLQTGRPSSSIAIRCPSLSQALISQHWMSRCRARLLPALRPWPPWWESSEFSLAWLFSAWTSSSTYTHTLSPLSTSTSSQAMRECPSFSPVCSATLSQCWTNRPPMAPRLLALLSQHRLQVVHLLPAHLRNRLWTVLLRQLLRTSKALVFTLT